MNLVEESYVRQRIELPNVKIRATIHAIVENQVAEGDAFPVREKARRLMAQGLDPHGAIHAIGSVVACVMPWHSLALDGFAQRGFDWIWLLSVWQTGAAGRAASRRNSEWRTEFNAVLPDLTEDDICGSGFAITGYTVSEELGGDAALAQFREGLARRGIKLMLDFVPNHTAPDHSWVRMHPDYYMRGDEQLLRSAPHNYMRLGALILHSAATPITLVGPTRCSSTHPQTLW